MKIRNLKLLSMLLAVVMLISVIDLPAFAAYSDTNGHWADKQISKWSDLGMLHGDGKNFRPNDPITRAEIAALLKNLMLYQTKSENKFSDVGNKWYTEAILGANASGIIVGYDNKLRPEDYATREETVVMLGSALAVKGGGAEKFTDNGKISAWAVDAVNAMVEKGYISGFPDGSFRPKAKITRAEVAAIVNNAVSGFYNKAGTYTENIEGTAVVNTYGVVLKDMTVRGDLILAEGIGSGDVTLDNVKIEGTTIVRGGGENSIIIKNSSMLGTVSVRRIDGKVSVKVQDGSEVEMIIIDDGSDDVIVTGVVGILQIDASDITVTAKAAVLSKVEVNGKKTTLFIDEKSSANTIEFNKGASNGAATINGMAKTLVSESEGLKVKGDGKLETAKINANNNLIEVVGAKVIASAGVTGTFAGTKAVATGTSEVVPRPSTTPTPTPTPTPTEPSTSNPTPSLSTVKISGNNRVEKGKTLQLSVSGLMSNNETANLGNAVIEWSVDKENVATINTQSGLLTAVDAGTVKVTVAVTLDDKTASTTFSITVTTPTPSENRVSIVEGGVAKASVVISSTADTQTKNAANKLIEYVKKSTGATLPLVIKDTSSANIIAENGWLKIIFDRIPDAQPSADDFRVQAIVNNVPGKLMQPDSMTWDAATLTATLNITPVEKSGIEQKMFYRVWYNDQFTLESGIITINEDLTIPINANPSFETTETVNDWSYPIDRGTGTIKRSDEVTRTGSYSVIASSVGLGWINYAKIKIDPKYNTYELIGYYYTPSGAETKGTVHLFVNFRDEDGNLFLNEAGQNIGLLKGDLVNSSDSNGQWKELKLEINIPEKINNKPVGVLQFGTEFTNFADGEYVYIDDIELRVKDSQKLSQPVETGKIDLKSDSVDKKTQIFVGREWLSSQEQKELLKDMKSDGFIINQKNEAIRIAGVSSQGTSFGVSEFLERYAEVQWLMPGESWEDVPKRSDISIPQNENLQQNPAFMARNFPGLNKMSDEWALNNRMNGTSIYINHGLAALYPPSKYKDTNPQFYPEGADLSTYNWQPCFQAEGIVEEGIKTINEYFDTHPEVNTYTLGINDTSNFSGGDPNKLNSLGMKDMSDIYFEWVKKVSEGVFEKHPDKYLSAYAYYNVYDPPDNVKLDPRVVIYITDERLSWNDPEIGLKAVDFIRRWANTGATLAFYEYLYGCVYMVPRTYFGNMADVYKHAAENGVEVMLSELCAYFGEGPKLWVSAKLQWDPSQDVDKLLDEWYTRAVGAASEGILRHLAEILGRRYL